MSAISCSTVNRATLTPLCSAGSTSYPAVDDEVPLPDAQSSVSALYHVRRWPTATATLRHSWWTGRWQRRWRSARFRSAVHHRTDPCGRRWTGPRFRLVVELRSEEMLEHAKSTKFSFFDPIRSDNAENRSPSRPRGKSGCTWLATDRQTPLPRTRFLLELAYFLLGQRKSKWSNPTIELDKEGREVIAANAFTEVFDLYDLQKSVTGFH